MERNFKFSMEDINKMNEGYSTHFILRDGDCSIGYVDGEYLQVTVKEGNANMSNSVKRKFQALEDRILKLEGMVTVNEDDLIIGDFRVRARNAELYDKFNFSDLSYVPHPENTGYPEIRYITGLVDVDGNSHAVHHHTDIDVFYILDKDYQEMYSLN